VNKDEYVNYTASLQGCKGANNLPRVVKQPRPERESNPPPLNHKSDDQSVSAPPRHREKQLQPSEFMQSLNVSENERFVQRWRTNDGRGGEAVLVSDADIASETLKERRGQGMRASDVT